jgi:hypothetical protein
MPPISVPLPGTQWCGHDQLAVINLLPRVERTNVLAGATWQVAPDHRLFAQYLYSYDSYLHIRHIDAASAAVTPQNEPILYPTGGPFYPAEFAQLRGSAATLICITERSAGTDDG